MTTFEIWTLIGGTAIGVGILKLIFHFGKIAKTIETIHQDLQSHKQEMKVEISEIKQHIRSIDGRLNHMEGAFFERGQWESRSYKMEKSPIDNKG